MLAGIALGDDPDAESFGEVGVDKEAHARSICTNENGVVNLGGSILDAGADIGILEEIIIGQDVCHACAAGQHVENVLYAQPVMTNARPSATLLRIEGNTM